VSSERASLPVDESACNPKPKSSRQTGRNPADVGRQRFGERQPITSEMPVNISLLPGLEDLPGANHNAAPFHASIGEWCSGEVSNFRLKCNLNAQ
jgi:hypothetical protein